MRLPLGRANTFEAAGKQGCDCMAWSRKRRTGFISRQGYMKALVPRRTSGQNVLNLWTHSRQGRRIFLSKLKWAGSHFRAFPPWLPFSKDGRGCQRRRICAPFILTVDWLGWLCYLADKIVFIAQIRQKSFTCSNSIFKSCWKWASNVWLSHSYFVLFHERNPSTKILWSIWNCWIHCVVIDTNFWTSTEANTLSGTPENATKIAPPECGPL